MGKKMKRRDVEFYVAVTLGLSVPVLFVISMYADSLLTLLLWGALSFAVWKNNKIVDWLSARLIK